jgi:hypothetical protein
MLRTRVVLIRDRISEKDLQNAAGALGLRSPNPWLSSMFPQAAPLVGNLIPKAAFALMPFTLVFQYRVKA